MHTNLPALIFDLDGTLIDSRPGIVGCLRKVLDAWQIDYRGSLDRFIGPPAEVWTAVLLPDGTEQARAEMACDYRGCYDLEGWKDVSVFAGVPEMLSQLRAKGFELYICTSKQQIFANRILDVLEIAEFFIGIYGDKLAFASHSKSVLLSKLLDERSIDRDFAWMIGDRIFDIEAAHANNVRCLAAQWGYGTNEELTSADNMAASPADVYGLVLPARLSTWDRFSD